MGISKGNGLIKLYIYFKGLYVIKAALSDSDFDKEAFEIFVSFKDLKAAALIWSTSHSPTKCK